MIQQVIQIATHPAVAIVASILTGWLTRKAYMNWRYGPPRNKPELIRDTITHQILADRAVERLDIEEIEALETEVQDELESAFGEDICFQITALDEVRDD